MAAKDNGSHLFLVEKLLVITTDELMEKIEKMRGKTGR